MFDRSQKGKKNNTQKGFCPHIMGEHTKGTRRQKKYFNHSGGAQRGSHVQHHSERLRASAWQIN